MDNAFAEQFSKYTKTMMDSVKELQSINEKTLQQLTEQQFKSAQTFIQTSSEQLEKLSQVKSVEEAINEQAKITSEIGEMMMANAQETMKVLSTGQKELEALISKAVKENLNK